MQAQPNPEPIVYRDPFAARQRLWELHPTLKPERLMAAIGYGIGHQLDCTEHDPPSAAGFIGWAKVNRALRDDLVLDFWEFANDQNFPLTFSPDRSLAIAVSSGDHFTGDPNALRHPATKREKGPVTREIVYANQQLSFWNVAPSSFKRPISEIPTWYLLYYYDDVEGRIRAELSLPMGLDGDGRIVSWSERIILFVDDDFFGNRTQLPSDRSGSADEIDIPVERIAG